MTNPNDPAFPKLPTAQSDMGMSFPGLSKREYFAALAMQGLRSANVAWSAEYVAQHAITQADALIAELNKEITP